jgi:branched-chain amino acid transport system permease protein
MGYYLCHLAVLIGIYAILAYALNLVTGSGGLLSFCQAAFYGIGAYTSALLQIGTPGRPAPDLLFTAAVPFPVAVLGAAVLAGLAGLAVGRVALRFRGDSFVFATLGIQMIVSLVLVNWERLGRGPYGLAGLPRPRLLTWEVDAPWEFALLVGAADAVLLPLMFALDSSPFGLSLKALRDDERGAESLGIPGSRRYLAALVISAVYAGVAGSLYASYVTYIDPSSFTLRESIFQVSLLLLGGSGNRRGPFLGVVVMILLPEVLRGVGVSDATASQVREILYGLTLIVLMRSRPQGLAGGYAVR